MNVHHPSQALSQMPTQTPAQRRRAQTPLRAAPSQAAPLRAAPSQAAPSQAAEVVVPVVVKKAVILRILGADGAQFILLFLLSAHDRGEHERLLLHLFN